MSQDLVLQVRDLNVWYRPSGTIGRRKRRQVLHDVSFDLHRGEILGLVGESGSGKTTLARTILGFVPDYTGTVTHFTKRPQMVFQDPFSSINPRMTVSQIIAAIGTFIISVLLMYMDSLASVVSNEVLSTAIQWFSFNDRYSTFTQGMFSISSVIFFISVVAVFVFLTARKVESRRWS